MEHLIAGVRDALRKESWYAALALALTLPDTCGAIEYPGRGKSKRRSIAWADAYVSKYFHLHSPPLQFLASEDLYLLRCSFLHEGDFDVEPDAAPSNDPDVRTAMFSVLNRVRLVVSDHEVIVSRGMADGGSPGARTTTCEVAVKDLCEWICKGVEEWLPLARSDQVKAERLSGLGRITVWRNYARSEL